MGKKGKKSKGKRRYRGKKKGRVSRKLSKPGLAESLGILKSVYDIETDANVWSNQKALLKTPTMAQAKYAASITYGSAKQHAGPAIVGIAVSNVRMIPVFGKLAGPLKTKVDRLVKKYTGMKL